MGRSTPGASAGFRRLNTLLYVQRFAACVECYRDGIGLPVVFSNGWFFEFEVNPGACLSVVEKARTRMRGTPFAAQTLTFEVDDVDAEHARLVGRGLTPGTVSPHGFGAKVFYLRDPEGNRLEFWSRT